MATTLVSPGVSVTVTDDSAYASSGQGTVPLFIIGTHEYKATPSGTLASGTSPTQANVLYLLSSQRELVQTFGNPVFYSNNGTALDGYELNEYGLHAAYQYLGIANSAYVIRGDIDYSQLVPSTSAPRGEPLDGTYWLDTGTTSYGVFQSNGNSSTGLAWDKQSVTVITDTAKTEWTIISSTEVSDPTAALITATGKLIINSDEIDLTLGDTLAQVVTKINSITASSGVSADVQYISGKKHLILKQSNVSTSLDINENSDASVLTDLGLYEKTFDATTLTVSNTTSVKNATLTPINTQGSNGSFAIVTTQNDNMLFKKIVNVVSGDTASMNALGVWFPVEAGVSVVQNGKTITPVPSDWQYAMQNCGATNTTCNKVTMAPSYKIPSGSAAGDIWVQTNAVNSGLDVSLKLYNASTGTWTPYTVVFYDSVANIPAATAVNTIAGIYGVTQNSATWQLVIWNGVAWDSLSYEASATAPTTDPEEGTMWYNPNFIVDIMVNHGGNQWYGYKNHPEFVNTDPNGPIVAGSAPLTQSTGAALVDNDIWINSSDTENYPAIYRYSTVNKTWTIVDNSDGITPFGIIFGDARQDDGNGSTSGSAMTSSNYVDPDAPNPELYPDGMLLFNTRYGTYNVKKWEPQYFVSGYSKTTNYTTTSYTVGTASFAPVTSGGRWVTVSGNNSDGTPVMGRKAQRKIIVEALAAVINSNQDIRSEDIYFSLIASPGYCELVDDMVELTTDKKNVAFVVGDTPARLNPTSTAIAAYANPTSTTAGTSEESITTASPYLGVYYPWGKGTNTDGSDIVIPPSTMAMRTIAYSDSISYPWFPPAGFLRGMVTNANTVGYINDKGEFANVLLNQGQRDTLYTNNINPIAYMANQGLVIYGQKTRQLTATAMNRINVARLVCYLNYQLDALAKPFLFELNNSHTRQSVQTTFSKFMADLLMKDAIYDYIVVCDDSNNTSDRIDNNELWIDVAIQPQKSIEFIYIPLRIVNTGTDMSSIYDGTTSA